MAERRRSGSALSFRPTAAQCLACEGPSAEEAAAEQAQQAKYETSLELERLHNPPLCRCECRECVACEARLLESHRAAAAASEEAEEERVEAKIKRSMVHYDSLREWADAAVKSESAGGARSVVRVQVVDDSPGRRPPHSGGVSRLGHPR